MSSDQDQDWKGVATPPVKTTTEAARLVGTTPNNLLAAIRNGRLAAPAKNASGAYWWTDADVERARAALAIDRRRKAVPA